MKGARTLFLLGMILLVLSVIGLAQTGKRKKPLAMPPNHPPTVSLTASVNAITLPCPPHMVSHSQACPTSANTSLLLTAKANDPDGDTLLYTYTVSGGRITGEGSVVSWDLSGLGAGPLTANVEVDDANGGVVTATTTMTIILCSDCVPICVLCPTVSVSCPTEADPNSSAVFTANFAQGTPTISETYKWTISAGTITSGQGTSAITVSTAGLGGQTLTATVEVGGIDPTCSRTASCSTPVKPPIFEVRPFDEYGNIRFADEKARLDNFAIQLQNEPGAFGYIVGYGSCDREGVTRATRAKNYIVNTRGIDGSRVITVDGGCLPELLVHLWDLPAGRKAPINASGLISPCPVCKKKPAPQRRSRPRPF
jgi:hypothetical protein